MTVKQLTTLAQKARKASHSLTTVSTEKKNAVLLQLSDALVAAQTEIIKANNKDIQVAHKKKLSPAMIDRLVLNEKRIGDMANAVREVAALPDPVGEITETREHNGISIKKMRIPIGVVCMIYESRPNVTVDAASLCFKSGNVVILRGGSEAFHSSLALVKIISKVLKLNDIDPAAVTMVPTTERSSLVSLLKLDKYIDVVIPRGGEGLMKFIAENTRIPVIKHDKGVCSLFVDESADFEKSLAVIENAKVQRPGVCNALETLYVHKNIISKFIPMLVERLSAKGVELRGDPAVRKVNTKIKRASEADYSTEYLDLILAVKSVKDVHDAIQHVIQYSSNHTDGILTENKEHASLYVLSLNSSCVTVNSSTRFNDGGQLGLGAEIGISTSKLHAYGPMGLKELTTQKYVVESDYNVRK